MRFSDHEAADSRARAGQTRHQGKRHEVTDQRYEESGRVGRAFRSTVGREGTTFGFSILVTVTFGVVSNEHGSAKTVDLLLYAVGAVLSFTLLTGALSRGFRAPMPQHPSEVVAFGAGLNLLSVLIAVLTAMGLSKVINVDALAWFACPFAAGLVYLVLESLETALGERVLMRQGDRDADQVGG